MNDQIFRFYDRDSDGRVTFVEAHQILGTSGLCPSVQEVQQKFVEEGSEKIDKEKMSQLLGKFKSSISTQDEIKNLFKAIDPQGSGRIDMNSVRFMLCNFQEQLSSDETSEFIKMILPNQSESTLIEIEKISSILHKMQTD